MGSAAGSAGVLLGQRREALCVQPSRPRAPLPRRPRPRAPRLGPPRLRCRGMDKTVLRAAAMGEKKEGGGGGAAAAADGSPGAAASRALQQCGQLQKLIDISIGSLRGLRTKCAVSNDLTQQEIRTLEVIRGRGTRGATAVHSFPSCILLPGRLLGRFLSFLHSLMRQRGDPEPALTLGRVWG